MLTAKSYGALQEAYMTVESALDYDIVSKTETPSSNWIFSEEIIQQIISSSPGELLYLATQEVISMVFRYTVLFSINYTIKLHSFMDKYVAYIFKYK